MDHTSAIDGHQLRFSQGVEPAFSQSRISADPPHTREAAHNAPRGVLGSWTYETSSDLENVPQRRTQGPLTLSEVRRLLKLHQPEPVPDGSGGVGAESPRGGDPTPPERPAAAEGCTTDLIQELNSGSSTKHETETIGGKSLEYETLNASEAERWAGRKRRSQDVIPALMRVDVERASKVKNCGTWLAIRHWVDHQRSSMYAANFCQQKRLCLACSHVRGMKLANAYADKAGAILADQPDLRPWLVTWTVRTGPDLVERFDHLQRGISSMWQRVKNAGKGLRKGTAFSAIEGLVVSTEIKRSQAAGHHWQPHAHSLALVDRRTWSPADRPGLGLVLEPSAHNRLCSEWHDITGDSYVLNAKPLTSSLAAEGIDRGALLCDLLEVFKYMTKPGNLAPADVVDVWQRMQGRRLVRSFGRLQRVQVPDGFEGESLSGDAWETWHLWELQQYLAVATKFVPQPGRESEK